MTGHLFFRRSKYDEIGTGLDVPMPCVVLMGDVAGVNKTKPVFPAARSDRRIAELRRVVDGLLFLSKWILTISFDAARRGRFSKRHRADPPDNREVRSLCSAR